MCCFFHALIIQNYWLNVTFCPALDGKQKLPFEEWWKHDVYGFNLFCEPVVEKPLIVTNEITDTDDYKYLRIDMNGRPEALRHMFNKFLDKNLKPQTDILSRARFQPSKKQGHIKLEKLKRYRETYIKRVIEGKTRKEILKERNVSFITDDKERGITKEVAKVKQIFKNIRSGTFP